MLSPRPPRSPGHPSPEEQKYRIYEQLHSFIQQDPVGFFQMKNRNSRWNKTPSYPWKVAKAMIIIDPALVEEIYKEEKDLQWED